MLGLPMTNVKRDAAGIVQTALQGAGAVELQYALDKLGLNSDKASTTFYDDLYRAMGTDWGKYENIYQDMVLRGWDQEKLADNMEKRMAKEAGLEKISSLPVGYSVPGENLTFDQEVMRQLEPEEGTESVTKMQKIRELRDSIWGDEVGTWRCPIFWGTRTTAGCRRPGRRGSALRNGVNCMRTSPERRSSGPGSRGARARRM